MNLNEYYRMKRARAFQKGKPLRLIGLRRFLHPVLLLGLKAGRIASGQKLAVIHDGHQRGKRPVVYVCNHIGWDDIAMTFEAIRDHAWLFWGNPEYRTPHYYALMGNGAVCVDTLDKEDRNRGKETAVRLIQAGQSLLIYPEGSWNCIPHLPVMKLFPGASEIAIRGGADIVPIGIAQRGLNEFCVSIGKNLSTQGYSLEDKWSLTEKIRDLMASEVWKTWEAFPVLKRDELSNHAQQEFEDFLTGQMKGAFTLDDVHAERFHDPKENEPVEAFEHLKDLIPSGNNAFLLRGLEWR